MTANTLPINLIGPTLDEIDAKMLHLQAMLHHTHGGARASFEGMTSDMRDHFMWGCAQLVDECIALSQHTVNLTIAAGKAMAV